MFARHEEHIFAGALQDLIHIVEFLGLREMADVSRVQQKLRRRRQRIDLIDRRFLSSGHVQIRRFVESHVAVADLHEAQLARCRGIRSQIGKPAQAVRLQYAALHHAQRARSCPRHALQKSAAIDSVLVVIVQDLVFHFLRHFVSPKTLPRV